MTRFRLIGTVFAGLALMLVVGVGTTLSQTKPKIAVLEIKNKAANQSRYPGVAEEAQDTFMTEIGKLGKFTVLDREQLQALLEQKNVDVRGGVDAKTAAKIGKLLGVNYLLIGTLTEYGVKGSVGNIQGLSAPKAKAVASLTSELIDSATGKSVWSRSETTTADSAVVNIGGPGNQQRMFDKTLKPTIVNLIANLKAANPVK